MKIGLFDSGIGGLTVLKEFLKVNASNDYIYVGDTKRVPYGSKSSDNIKLFARQIVDFLIDQKVDMIIIACGTVTAVAINDLKQEYQVPIYGVIEPTCEYINNQNFDNVGIIATNATINSQEWNRRLNCPVRGVKTPLLVPIIEEGCSDPSVIDLVLKMYLKELGDIDALVLGCTHYPLLAKKINQYYNNKTEIIDMGKISAETLLTSGKKDQGQINLYFTDITTEMNQFITNYMKPYKYNIRIANLE